ncbi:MAG: SEL1-like repeat protein [Paracoccaceae bacterium]|nr:SEL1-like repeat protein [Paracoccaceae bacterium]
MALAALALLCCTLSVPLAAEEDAEALPLMAQVEQAWAQGNFVFVREGLKTLAEEEGTPLAQYRYGRVLLEGRGGPRDVEAAMDWLEKAVAQNHLEATTLLARVLLSIRPPQTDKAMPLLNRAAARGDADAQFFLAELQTDSDPAAAFDWYLAAAEQEHVAAQYELARAYARGHGTGVNTAEALRWLTAAGEAGHVEAQYYLGQTYETGQLSAKNPAEALRWYRRAAEAGLPLAQRELGTRYLEGMGVEVNADEALRWLQAAAEAGDPGAMYNLGQAYVSGKVLAQDDARAFRLFDLAAGSDLPRGITALAAMYEAGRGTTADPDLAIALYRKAVEAGDRNAAVRLGTLALAGQLDGKLAPQRAVPWVVEVARAGDDKAAALAWLETQADTGMRNAMTALALLLLDEPDRASDGTDLLQRAAAAGDIRAQGLLGQFYTTGEHGLALDYVAAHTWLNLAAAAGDDEAMQTRDLISELMTPEQVADAQAAARAYYENEPGPPKPAADQ